jgi:hypothetical protein
MGCAKRIPSFCSLAWNGLHGCPIRVTGFLRLGADASLAGCTPEKSQYFDR